MLSEVSRRLDAWSASFDAWSSAGGRAPVVLLVLALVLGAALAASPAWRFTRVFVTLFHEFGHAFAGLLVGAKVTGIRLRLNTSGVTHWSYRGSPGRLRTAWVAWWGYPAPALLGGTGLAALLQGLGRPWALFLSVLTLLVVLAWVRSLWGLVVAALLLALCVPLVHLSAPAAQLLTAAASAFLVVGALRTGREHLREPLGAGSDSEQVRRQLFVPVTLVKWSFLAASALFPLALVLAAWKW